MQEIEQLRVVLERMDRELIDRHNVAVEECARLVESFLHKDDAPPSIEEVAAALRELKK